jgi:hypothetical protein
LVGCKGRVLSLAYDGVDAVCEVQDMALEVHKQKRTEDSTGWGGHGTLDC